MSMRKKMLIMPLFAILLLASCAKKQVFIGYSSAADQFNSAMKLYQKGHYEAAREGFKNVIYKFPMSEYVDDAQFYIAMSYMKQKNYESAINEFQFLIENYPYSDHIEEAVFRIAEAYYLKSLPPDRDQSDTRNAMQLAEQFLSQYPNSKFADDAREIIQKCRNKLALKMLVSVKTFINLEKYRSAEIYLDLFDRDYSDTDARWLAKYYRALLFSRTGKKDKAVDILQSLMQNRNVPPDVRAKAGALYWKIAS